MDKKKEKTENKAMQKKKVEGENTPENNIYGSVQKKKFSFSFSVSQKKTYVVIRFCFFFA